MILPVESSAGEQSREQWTTKKTAVWGLFLAFRELPMLLTISSLTFLECCARQRCPYLSLCTGPLWRSVREGREWLSWPLRTLRWQNAQTPNVAYRSPVPFLHLAPQNKERSVEGCPLHKPIPSGCSAVFFSFPLQYMCSWPHSPTLQGEHPNKGSHLNFWAQKLMVCALKLYAVIFKQL